ncbi:PP0621 family protein [Massilia sp. 2TAF26]|uniref:PP0621 family protein n=1 Tax=Massilia sp. 2TAF26 TaxID=3233012 RepID=UPI003F9E2A81
MTRLLFWIALIILVVMAVRSKLRAAVAARTDQPQPGQGPDMSAAGAPVRPQVEDSERMTSCAQCGIYFPASESVREGGRDYCSQAHARQAAASRID